MGAARTNSSANSSAGVQRRPSQRLLRAFSWYCAWYLWLYFRSLRVAHVERFAGLSATQRPLPTIIFLNHASWWDPLVCIRLARRLLPGYEHYAPMDASALARYGFFRKIGLFPVEMGTAHGAISFLQTAQEILRSQNSVLWITPQGRKRNGGRSPEQPGKTLRTEDVTNEREAGNKRAANQEP